MNESILNELVTVLMVVGVTVVTSWIVYQLVKFK